MIALVMGIFIIGYLAIALEHTIHVNKAASAILTGVLCWGVYIWFAPSSEAIIDGQLIPHLGELSQILFFLLGAMTIVELVDAHNGFEILTKKIKTNNKRNLIWIICLFTFFLSALLDNLTTTIVMISVVRKIVNSRNDRLLFAGGIIIAANAGGAWSPIGDVTTTMLWIGGQITAITIITKLIIPSLVCLIVPLLFLQRMVKGQVQPPQETNEGGHLPAKYRNITFFTGIGGLVMVPVLKTVFHLPPFMGMLLALGLIWVVLEVLYRGQEEVKSKYSVSNVLRKIDTPSILFFLGILLAVAALESMGQLEHLATTLNTYLKNVNLIVLSIGLLSSVVDNVPLVAASMGMYSLEQFPADHYFWQFLAYAAGTGGSALIIGSAAGVAAMGLEKIDFMWYLKRISILALIGYLSGAGVFILLNS